MNRITRCPSCATVYRVGGEQLQAASGWLRCGQCLDVFDSTGLVLFWQFEESRQPSAFEQDSACLESAAVTTNRDRIAIEDLLKKQDQSAASGASPVCADLESFEEALSTFQAQRDLTTVSLAVDNQTSPVVPSSSRRLWQLTTCLLSACLFLQLLFVQRHTIAEHWPQSVPLLEGLCHALGCELAPLNDVDGLVIESSSLVRRSGEWVLSWGLRNNTRSSLGMTALEVTLLDATDKPVVRKVFLPDQVRAPAKLSPNQVWSGELILQVDDHTVFTDYRILSFYP